MMSQAQSLAKFDLNRNLKKDLKVNQSSQAEAMVGYKARRSPEGPQLRITWKLYSSSSLARSSPLSRQVLPFQTRAILFQP